MRQVNRAFWPLAGVLLTVGGLCLATTRLLAPRLGRQKDGSFIVATGQRIEPGTIAFDGRPVDIALHPSGQFFAVLSQKAVFLATRAGVIEGSAAPLDVDPSFRGLAWSPDGERLFASVSHDRQDRGHILTFRLEGQKLVADGSIEIRPEDDKANPRPGGMTITRDGKRLFVAALDRNAVVEVDLTTNKRLREYSVQELPFEVKLSDDEKSLIVSNWGGREPKDDDDMAQTGNTMIVVDPRGLGASGTVSLIRLETGDTVNFPVGLHPSGIAVQGNLAYIADSAADDISVVDVRTAHTIKTLPLTWGKMNLFGSMPCALAIQNQTLYIANGGDNAICELDIASGKVKGYRPAGFYPLALALSTDGRTAFVLNSKGNGSVRRTVKGEAGNSHDFQGTVSVVDLTADLNRATERVAANNGWNRDRKALKPNLAVYNGAIEHVIYIIKENRTYDQVLGDLPQGDGDPKLCDLGGKITPNAHALVQQFTLFDNAYVSGTNSADGHNWSTQALANDYLEHFYDSYRTYPDDGDCAMSLSNGGCLWEAALKKGKTFRDYGEFCDDELAVFTPKVTSWLEVWKDRISGKRRIQKSVQTRVPSLRPYINPHYGYWPLLQSDQGRADLFIGEYQQMSRRDRVPNLMILSLPCDHTEGRDPNYPKPQSMVADNDLALGRIVEAVSHSPQWKHTCIFVIEDDAQSGYDHVDGHRTVFMAFSPWIRRKFVDHSLYTTCSMIRSIELMLRLDPMTRFDALDPPPAACFMEQPDYSPYVVRQNEIALDDMNPPKSAQTGRELYWTDRSLALDWSGPDRADPDTLNRVLWHTLHGVNTPYPVTPGGSER